MSGPAPTQRPLPRLLTDPRTTSRIQPPLNGATSSPLSAASLASIDSTHPIDGPQYPHRNMSIESGAPLSASSSSSSFNWPQASSSRTSSPAPFGNQNVMTDPFDNTTSFSEDPFSHRSNSSSSGDDEMRHIPASSPYNPGEVAVTLIPDHLRTVVPEPLIHTGQQMNPELSSSSLDHFDFHDAPAPPRFDRTYSAPLPNRVGFLRHPIPSMKDPYKSFNEHIPSNLGRSNSSMTSSTSDSTTTLQTPLSTLSLELADALQSAIQTLLHLSPPHLLDNAKEQYSGCSIQMPSTSLSALLTSMRSLNFLSANAHGLFENYGAVDTGILSTHRPRHDFDIGELLQNVADLLSGQASHAGVDLVLFHGDVSIKHVSVSGDVEGLSYTLSHILRQILLVANRGDVIELGLQIIPQSPSMTPRVSLPLSVDDVDASRQSSGRPSSPGKLSSPFGSGDGPMLCIFEIVHNISQAIPGSAAATPRAEINPFTNLAEEKEAMTPKLDSLFTRRIIDQQRASLKLDAQPSSPLGSGMPRRAYELSVLLPRGQPLQEPPHLTVEEEALRQPFTSVRLAREPTLNELSEFAESLRGKKVFLHASLQSVFARHLTSYLGAWGMDISHIPIEESEEVIKQETALGASDNTEKFIIIDDDVDVLRKQLIQMRATNAPISLKPRLTKRPTLASRARSTPHIRQVSGPPKPSPVIIHFTSLSKYNHVRDVVSNILGTPWMPGAISSIADVMVIPKPVGPRRFLTSLHTAVSQPVIDPYFSPIATTPRSPGGYFPNAARSPMALETHREGFFDSLAEEGPEHASETGSQKAKSPFSENPPARPDSNAGPAGMHLNLPTPGDVVTLTASEYFSNAINNKNAGAAGGLVIQSPDGRPFGMYFEPPTKGERRQSHTRTTSSSLIRKPGSRRASGANDPPSTNGTPAVSPKTYRRQSGLSTSSTPGGTPVMPSSRETPKSGDSPLESTFASRAAMRRRTMSSTPQSPAQAAEEPFVATGRDRSNTVTQRSRKSTTLSTPKVASPSTENVPASATGTPAKKAPKAKKAGKDSGVVVPPINVLIVEDNPINVNILSMFLKKKKIKYDTAKDGREAVDKWRTGGFHLILMDIQLPVMDGKEATKEIRRLEKEHNIGVFPNTPQTDILRQLSEAPPTPGPPPPSPFASSVIIVALTASSLQVDRVMALAAGCNDFLTKPVSLKWLERKILEWGCMQALIDFDGMNKWKSTDLNETKKGFSLGPQAAARSLADRLKIERRPGSRSPGPTARLAAKANQPEIQIRTATPPIASSDDPLQEARKELVEAKVDIVPPSQSAEVQDSTAPQLSSITEDLAESLSSPAPVAKPLPS